MSVFEDNKGNTFLTLSDGTKYILHHRRQKKTVWDKVKMLAEMVTAMTPAGKVLLGAIWIVAFFVGMAVGLYL